jgi:DinB superfamily
VEPSICRTAGRVQTPKIWRQAATEIKNPNKALWGKDDFTEFPRIGAKMSDRSEALAARLDAGAAALAAFAATLSDTEWQTRVPHDGRKVGVVVHHVASVYPIEIQIARTLAAGQPITGVTWDAVNTMNRDHAKDNDGVTKQAALDLLKKNSAEAAAAIRSLSDEELDRAAPVSLNSDAPLTCQFILEDHAVRHSYHHLARIRAALAR